MNNMRLRYNREGEAVSTGTEIITNVPHTIIPHLIVYWDGMFLGGMAWKRV